MKNKKKNTPKKNHPFKATNLLNSNNWQCLCFIAKSNLPDDMKKKMLFVHILMFAKSKLVKIQRLTTEVQKIIRRITKKIF